MMAAANTSVLTVHGLHFSWPGVPLFQNLNLLIPAGVSVVCGEESSGKTTLLRLLSRDLVADSGSFVFNGDKVSAEVSAEMQSYRTQVFRTDPRSDALDAISAAAWFSSLPSRYPSFDTSVALEFAHGFSLATHLEKPMYMLSAGSKRKVWLCAAFAAGTALTLIDEPFAALDVASIRFLHGLLEEASEHVRRAWLLADHAPPNGIELKARLVLGG